MVHALELVHGLLAPGGLLVDIHPTGEPPVFAVQVGERITPAGLLQESDNFIEYSQASQALERAVSNGWFQRQAQSHFRFTTYASNPAELLDYLRAEWQDAVLLPEVTQQLGSLFAAAGHGAQAILRERVLINSFIRTG